MRSSNSASIFHSIFHKCDFNLSAMFIVRIMLLVLSVVQITYITWGQEPPLPQQQIQADVKPAETPKPAAENKDVTDKTQDSVKTPENKTDTKQPADKQEEKPAELKPEETKKKQDANPVANVIKGIFGGGKGIIGPVVEEPHDPENDSANGDTSARDEIDEKAPFNREQASLLISARKHAKQENWDKALPQIQKILDSDSNSVLRNDQDRYQSIRSLAMELLNTAPSEVLNEYAREYSPLANKLLEQANASGEPKDLALVANKYFHTPAGQQAATRLSLIHADRGELAMSHIWILRLEQAKAAVTKQADWIKYKEHINHAIHVNHVIQGESKKTPGDKPIEKSKPAPEASAANPPAEISLSSQHSPLQTLVDSIHKSNRLISDWYYAFGNVTRNGIAKGQQPLLIQRWKTEFSRDFKVQNYIHDFLEEIRLNEITAIPAQTLVKSGNTVVVKSLHSILAININSGEKLWETEFIFSPEQILAGKPIQLSQAFPQMILRAQANWGGMNLNRELNLRPAGQVFFSDANYGQLSTNGHLVFAVTDLVHLAPYEQSYSWGWGGDNSLSKQDPLGRDWSSNKLVAYDLKSGAARWMVGGRKLQEKFDLPLAGTYFFGPPLPHGDLLYVVGETDGEIKLLALNAQDGQLQWSQVIGYADLKIEVDALRRFYTSPITISQGMLLCATHDGWITAIDTQSHDIIWCERYEALKPKTNRSNRYYYNRFDYKEFTHNWLSQPPLVHNFTAVFFPNDSTEMIAINLVTGKINWRKKKEAILYAAGCHAQNFLFVSENSLEAIDAGTGKTAWTVKYPAEAAKVSGFSQHASNFLLIPFFDGRILSIDLSTPEHQLSWSAPAEGDSHLGNIFFADNSIISVNPAGITAFEQLEPTLKIVAERMQKNQQDSWSLITSARIALLKEDYHAAISSLDKVDPKLCQGNELTSYHQLLWDVLYGITRKELTSHEDSFKRLETLADSPLKLRDLELLGSERLLAADKLFEAHQSFTNILQPGKLELIPDFYDKHLEVSLPLYISSRLEDVWNRATPELKERLTAEISQKLTFSSNQVEMAALTYWLDVFRFHPLADEVTFKLTKTAFENKDYASFDYYAHRLSQVHQDEVVLMQAELLMHYKFFPDAKQICDQHFLNFFTDIKDQSQERGRGKSHNSSPSKPDAALFRAHYQQTNPNWLEHWDQLQTQLNDQNAHQYPTWSPAWNTDRLSVKRLGGDHYNNSNQHYTEIINPHTPFLQHHFHYYDPRSRTLSFRNYQDDHVALFSLKHASKNADVTSQIFYHRDHLLVCINSGVLQMISLPDKKTTWSKLLDNRQIVTHDPNQGYEDQADHDGGHNNTIPVMVKLREHQTHHRNKRQVRSIGTLAAVTPGVVITHGHKEVIAVDALSGKTRWKRRHLLETNYVAGDNQLVYLVDNVAGRSLCIDTFSGRTKPAETKKLIDNMAKFIQVIGHDLILIENTPGAQVPVLGVSKSLTTLKRYSPLQDKIIWQQSFDQNGYGALISQHQFVTLSTQGQVEMLNIHTGRSTPYGSIGSDVLKFVREINIKPGLNEIFLMYSKNSNNDNYYYSGLRSARLHGELICLKPNLKDAAWKQKIDHSMIVLNDFEQAPYIAAIKMKYISEDEIYYQEMNVEMFDKRTGAKLLNEKLITQDSLQNSRLSLKHNYWEFGTYNMRFRVTPVQPEKVSGQPTATNPLKSLPNKAPVATKN